MAPKHKTVAVRIDGVKDGVRVTALTQTPRGTRVMSGSVQVSTKGRTREEFVGDLTEAFEELNRV